jgi:predicted RNA-binding Zn-ribbon protein involved in translation (DUF1610 family)
MSGQPVVIYSAASTQQAYLLKSLLEAQGIRAWVVNDAMQMAGGELPLGWTAAARVVVSDDQATEARQFAEGFDRQIAEPTNYRLAEFDATEPWSEWPTCPTCGSRRSVRCPTCRTSGTDFMLADVQNELPDANVLLKCEACDDVFEPEWYRVCPQCGYDFGSGIEIGEAARPQPRRNLAVTLLAAGLAAVGSGFVAYFFWLFS